METITCFSWHIMHNLPPLQRHYASDISNHLLPDGIQNISFAFESPSVQL